MKKKEIEEDSNTVRVFLDNIRVSDEEGRSTGVDWDIKKHGRPEKVYLPTSPFTLDEIEQLIDLLKQIMTTNASAKAH